MSQIALPLLATQSGDPARIIIGTGNQSAAAALARPQDWPFRTAILTGPARSGKSLFARWFAAQGVGDAIDGADGWNETELFHRWNRAQEAERPLLLVIDGDNWDIALPDLRSRMGAALWIEIGPLDDESAGELMLSHAERRGLALGAGAPTYLIPRMERSYAAIERVIDEIDRLSLERKVAPTLSVWRDALDAVQGPEQRRLL